MLNNNNRDAERTVYKVEKCYNDTKLERNVSDTVAENPPIQIINSI